MDEWKITFLIKGADTISIKVKSNNEGCARQSATRKLLMQYHHLHLGHDDYKIIGAKLIQKHWL